MPLHLFWFVWPMIGSAAFAAKGKGKKKDEQESAKPSVKVIKTIVSVLKMSGNPSVSVIKKSVSV
ncbi:hypothetical protein [Maridesulfovibrio sp.]|uniref:hypothetical protein n=1 Tax=Maridesulfovibrio sp. TaxID=2795000 RepID=UPI002A189B3A|nr:hypothetical protein [Maridesulfovibrio sp.]